MMAVCVGVAAVGLLMLILGLACIRIATRGGRYPE